MSLQFGRWNFDGQPVSENYLQQVRSMIATYGPDDSGRFEKGNISILHQAFYTTKESYRQTQPMVLRSGTVLTWDGRLDNREDLISQLPSRLPNDSPDLSIVAAIYENSGTVCFPQLIGDWALAAWNPSDRSLVLAKDFVGTRHLYYSIQEDHVSWSTILDPLVLLAGHSFDLELEYVAGWLSSFPAAHLTPYVGIQSVPPSSFIRIANRKATITKYWNFDPSHRIRYRTDAEYEEHFRAVFFDSVRRRLRADRPVAAELSGGMDSSSIVCVADTITHQAKAETPRVDTVSYYDDSEPNWNERPYFTLVEQRRGQDGCHIDVHPDINNFFAYVPDHFAAIPASNARATASAAKFAQFLSSRGHRVVLSGIGGDEVLGGVPTPIPELADLLARCHLRTFAKKMVAWALAHRRPLLQLLDATVRSFLPIRFAATEDHSSPIAWIEHSFAGSHRTALRRYDKRFEVFGPLPSFQDNLATLDGLRRQLACSVLPSEPTYETRYPYTDRDLLEFLYAIPREQLVRPHDRRSLMRRALAGTVPTEILNRKRKAFVVRSPLSVISANWTNLVETTPDMFMAAREIIDPASFLIALADARHGLPSNTISIMRALEIEQWLQKRGRHGLWRYEQSPTFDTRRRVPVALHR